MSIANSPLVKTAIAGEDANWGRVVMAVGKAGEPADRDRLAIWFGDVRVAVAGARDPAYDEAAASAVMQRPEVTIRVDLGLGAGRARIEVSPSLVEAVTREPGLLPEFESVEVSEFRSGSMNEALAGIAVGVAAESD